jgi:hypothetical protein
MIGTPKPTKRNEKAPMLSSLQEQLRQPVAPVVPIILATASGVVALAVLRS